MKWLAAIALSAAAAAAGAAPRRGPTAASETARQVLRQHCGPCHHGELPERKPKAIAIFDSRDKKWFAGLKDRQLTAALKRVQGIPDEEKKAFTAFVDAELRARKPGSAR